ACAVGPAPARSFWSAAAKSRPARRELATPRGSNDRRDPAARAGWTVPAGRWADASSFCDSRPFRPPLNSLGTCADACPQNQCGHGGFGSARTRRTPATRTAQRLGEREPAGAGVTAGTKEIVHRMSRLEGQASRRVGWQALASLAIQVSFLR